MGTISILNCSVGHRGRDAAPTGADRAAAGPGQPSSATLIYGDFGNTGAVLLDRAHDLLADICDNHCAGSTVGFEAALRTHFHQVRSHLRSHPALAPVLHECGRRDHGALLGRHGGRHVDALVATGMDRALATSCFTAITAFTVAHVIRTELSDAECCRCDTDFGFGDLGTPGRPADDGQEEFELLLELMLRGVRATSLGR